MQRAIYGLSRRRPDLMRSLVLSGVRKQLGPDADLSGFGRSYDAVGPAAVRRPGRRPVPRPSAAARRDRHRHDRDVHRRRRPARLRTRNARRHRRDGDGLQVQLLGGAELVVDGRAGAGRTNCSPTRACCSRASPTRAGLRLHQCVVDAEGGSRGEYLVRLLRHMDARGLDRSSRTRPDGEREDGSVMSSLRSGYVPAATAGCPARAGTCPGGCQRLLARRADAAPGADRRRHRALLPQPLAAAHPGTVSGRHTPLSRKATQTTPAATPRPRSTPTWSLTNPISGGPARKAV